MLPSPEEVQRLHEEAAERRRRRLLRMTPLQRMEEADRLRGRREPR